MFGTAPARSIALVLKRLLAWLRRLFGRAERRELLRLPAAGATSAAASGGLAQDVVAEEVRRRGPLKPLHLRQIARDERLMPKPGRRTAWPKPPPVMTADEAARLF